MRTAVILLKIHVPKGGTSECHDYTSYILKQRKKHSETLTILIEDDMFETGKLILGIAQKYLCCR